jgi:hypothetical protein
MRPWHKQIALEFMIQGCSGTLPSVEAFNKAHPHEQFDGASYWSIFMD